MTSGFHRDIAKVIIAVSIAFMLGSCTSSRKVTSFFESHRIDNLVQRMDSIITAHSVVRQDSTWRELILQQFQSIRERNDTSRLVVTDTAGRVIKETIIIRSERETSSQVERQEREVLLHRLEIMDSTLVSMRLQQQRTDSLIQQKNRLETKEVRDGFSFWQQAQFFLGRLMLIVVIVASVVWIIRKRMPLFHRKNRNV